MQFKKQITENHKACQTETDLKKKVHHLDSDHRRSSHISKIAKTDDIATGSSFFMRIIRMLNCLSIFFVVFSADSYGNFHSGELLLLCVETVYISWRTCKALFCLGRLKWEFKLLNGRLRARRNGRLRRVYSREVSLQKMRKLGGNFRYMVVLGTFGHSFTHR